MRNLDLNMEYLMKLNFKYLNKYLNGKVFTETCSDYMLDSEFSE